MRCRIWSRARTRSALLTIPDPRVGRTSVARILSRVVFPDPFGPKRTRVSPGARSRSTPRRAHVPRKALPRPRTDTPTTDVPLCTTLPVCLPHDEIDTADDGDRIGDHMPLDQPGQRLDIHKGRGPELNAPGLVGSIGHHVEPDLPLGTLHRDIGLPGRHVEAVRIEEEVMDQGLHALPDHSFRRWDNLGIVDIDRPARHLLQGLPQGDFEVKSFVAGVGVRFPEIPGDATGPQIRAGEPPGNGFFRLDHADAFATLDPEGIAG